MQRPGNLKERFPGGFVNHHKTPCAVQACRRDHDILPSSADSDSLCPSIRVLSATRKRTDDFHKKQMSGYSQTRPSHPARQWGPACGNQVQNHRQRKALHIRHKDSSSDHTAAHEVQSLLSEVAALRLLWLLRGSFIPHPEAYLQAVRHISGRSAEPRLRYSRDPAPAARHSYGSKHRGHCIPGQYRCR